MNDTHPDIQKKMIEIFSAMSVEEKLEKTGRLYASGKFFAELAVKREHPGLEDIDLKIAVFKWMHQSKMSKSELNDVESYFRNRMK